MNQQPQLPPDERARLIAQRNLSNAFTKEAIEVFGFLSTEIIPLLSDYFTLVEDLKNNLSEEYRHCYSDYCFVVVPVHKAFECYLMSFFKIFFSYKFSNRRNESLGHYLFLDDAAKRQALTAIQTNNSFLKVDIDKWVQRWKALAEEWTTNRNPLMHSDGEKIITLSQAEIAANSIIREMNVSVKLIFEELFDPLLKKAQEDIEKKEKEKIEKNKELLGPIG